MAIDWKNVLTSKTVIGATVAIVAGGLGVIFKLNADDSAIVKDNVEVILTAVAGVVGGVIALVGRLKAKDKLTTGEPLPPSN